MNIITILVWILPAYTQNIACVIKLVHILNWFQNPNGSKCNIISVGYFIELFNYTNLLSLW